MQDPTAAHAPLQLRPVCPQDRSAMCRFLQGLSVQSRGLRFHGGVKPDSELLLSVLTQADGRDHIALVAVLDCDDGELIVGEARVVRGSAGEPAEFAIAVADAWQGRGLAQRLLDALLAQAAAAGMLQVFGDVLAHNERMAGFMQRAGFVPVPAAESGVQRWMVTLAAPQVAPPPALQSPVQPAMQPLVRPATRGWRSWFGSRFGLAAR